MIKPTNKQRIAVAMSGGVDSSAAAYLLKKEGYDVIGFSMQLWPKNTGGGCCGVNAMNDAARVAAELDIPHYILDVRKEFQEKIIDNFYMSYEVGETPNPCVRCNEFIKFDYLLEKAKELDAKLATGHYAQIEYDAKNNYYRLIRGVDETKDQAYTLYRLSQHQLSQSLFPIGKFMKKEIREIAKKANIYVAEKPESQDICFQDKTNFRELMAAKAPMGTIPGDIVNTKGEILGKHQGIAFYTIGQRRRLGIAAKHPLYVLKIDAEKNRVIVGFEEELTKFELNARDVNFIQPNLGENPFHVTAKIRYASPEVEAEVLPNEKRKARVVFNAPQKGIAPGQSVVFYRDDEILGGGIIEKESNPVTIN